MTKPFPTNPAEIIHWQWADYEPMAQELVERPVTVVVGRHDVTSTLEAGAEFAGLFPVGRLDVRDGPHLLSLERPDETESAIFDHLAWIGRG